MSILGRIAAVDLGVSLLPQPPRFRVFVHFSSRFPRKLPKMIDHEAAMAISGGGRRKRKVNLYMPKQSASARFTTAL